MNQTQVEAALAGRITSQMKAIAERESLSADLIRRRVADGQIIIANRSIQMQAAPRLLADDATGNTRAAAAKRFGSIGIVVPTGMNDQGMTFQVFEFKPWRQHRLPGLAGCIRKKDRQVAQVPIVIGSFMGTGTLRIKMTAGCQAGNHATILLLWVATAFLMQVEPMQPRRQSGQFRCEKRSERGLGGGDGSDFFAGPFRCDIPHIDDNPVRLSRSGNHPRCNKAKKKKFRIHILFLQV